GGGAALTFLGFWLALAVPLSVIIVLSASTACGLPGSLLTFCTGGEAPAEGPNRLTPAANEDLLWAAEARRLATEGMREAAMSCRDRIISAHWSSMLALNSGLRAACARSPLPELIRTPRRCALA